MTDYLEINELVADPRLSGLLPPELAYRYHALPIAGKGDAITVAMADPNNAEARQAIMNVLGSSACIIQANEQTIDRVLAELWDKSPNPSPHLLYWTYSKSTIAKIETYAQALAALLDANISQFESEKNGNQAYLELCDEVERLQADVVVLGGIEQSILKGFIEGPPEIKLVDQIPASLLVIRQPRWPLKYILLVLRNESQDSSAIDWTIRIAQPSCAKVTILPLTMPVPVMYDQIPRMRCSITALLSSNCNRGRSLRLVARRLVASEIEGTLRLRQESPAWQIHFELKEREYDLVVIANEPHNRLCRWLYGGLVNPLLSWAEMPVLVTKPSTV